MLRVTENRQRQFAKEFFLDFNATAAYRRVYKVKGKSAIHNASRLIINDKVQRYLQEEFLAIQERLEIEQDRMMLEVCRLGYSDMRHVARWGPWGVELKDSEMLPDDVAAAVEQVQSVRKTRHWMAGETPMNEEEVRTNIKLHSKTAALKMLAEFFRRGDPMSADMDAQLRTLILIMAQYVSHDRLEAFRAHIYAAFQIELPSELGASPPGDTGTASNRRSLLNAPRGVGT